MGRYQAKHAQDYLCKNKPFTQTNKRPKGYPSKDLTTFALNAHHDGHPIAFTPSFSVEPWAPLYQRPQKQAGCGLEHTGGSECVLVPVAGLYGVGQYPLRREYVERIERWGRCILAVLLRLAGVHGLFSPPAGAEADF